MFNKNKPNKLVFDSKLKKENLKITKYGEANLNKLNGEFVYRAIIQNVLQRPVLVGSENPNYTPLDQISPYLQKCVLTSEDPSFFSHRGFINEAFKQSILKNIRTKKFSRGASTISMQLIYAFYHLNCVGIWLLGDANLNRWFTIEENEHPLIFGSIDHFGKISQVDAGLGVRRLFA